MKIIEPSVELVDQFSYADICNKIEKCGRVCWQSEPKGKPEDFIRMLIKRGNESVLEHSSLTFHIICDRAIQNELVRHRLASFSVESTRYVKYDELVTVQENDIVYSGMAFWTENAYKGLLQQGYPPEIARAVLPLCTKSELYMTANLREWRHILKLRTSPKAHPQMRFIAGKILDIFKKKLSRLRRGFVMICPQCHCRFTPHHFNQKYCSDTCRVEVRKIRRYAKNAALRKPIRCAWCFEWFTPANRKNQIFCCKRCATSSSHFRHRRKHNHKRLKYYHAHKLEIKIRRIRKELAK